MSEQNQSLYQRYIAAVRANPGVYVAVKDGDRLVTFNQECTLFAFALNIKPKPINGHLQLTLTEAQAEQLKAKFDLLEV